MSSQLTLSSTQYRVFSYMCRCDIPPGQGQNLNIRVTVRNTTDGNTVESAINSAFLFSYDSPTITAVSPHTFSTEGKDTYASCASAKLLLLFGLLWMELHSTHGHDHQWHQLWQLIRFSNRTLTVLRTVSYSAKPNVTLSRVCVV